MEPNFAEYILDELLEVKQSLDKNKYPERYERLLSFISTHEQKPNDPKLRGNQESEEALRLLFKEYKKEKFHVWTMLRGAVVMFITFRVMQYFEWSNTQQVAGAIVVLVIYCSILISVNEYKFCRFKSDFKKRS